jgi:hypothetical protein
MGLFRAFVRIASSGLDIAEARDIVREGLKDALSTMDGMVGNAGQQSVFNDYVEPAFIENTGRIEDGWTDVDIGEYMDFMGEIVEEGNSIMADAYDEAQDILSEIEEAMELYGVNEDLEYD